MYKHVDFGYIFVKKKLWLFWSVKCEKTHTIATIKELHTAVNHVVMLRRSRGQQHRQTFQVATSKKRSFSTLNLARP